MFVGVDLHKETFTSCYMQAEDDCTLRTFPNTQDGLAEFIQTIGFQDEVAVESISFARPFLQQVAPHVHRVTFVHAGGFRLITDSAKKTDANDAQMLAYGLMKGILPTATIRSELAMQIKSLLNMRRQLVDQAVQLRAIMAAMLGRAGIRSSKNEIKSRIFRRSFDLELLKEGDRIAFTVAQEQLVLMEAHIAQLKRAVELMAPSMRGYNILIDIPYIGPTTAAALLACIDGIERFPSASKLVSYIGLAPVTRRSAGHALVPSSPRSRFKVGRISGAGDPHVRSLLVQLVSFAKTRNASLEGFYQRIRGRRGWRKARVAVARKLLTYIWHVLTYPQLAVPLEKVDFAKPFPLPGDDLESRDSTCYGALLKADEAGLGAFDA